MTNRIVLSTGLIFSVLCTGCGPGGSGADRNSESQKDSVVIEWMRHQSEGLTVERSVNVPKSRSSFNLAETRFRVLDRWPHSEAKHEVLDDNPNESHAVELSWESPGSSEDSDENSPQNKWIFQSDGHEGVVTPLGKGLQVRLLSPGARPSWDGLWTQDPRRTIQFALHGVHHALPADGEEVFPGWKLRQVRFLTHALLQDSGGLRESSDTGFTNRAVEATLVSNDGATVERHIAFLDHPEITKGIHPALLPVSRLSGESASHSRLVVSDRLDKPGKANSLFLSPTPSDPERLIAFTWDYQSKAISEVAIDQLPAEITLPDRRTVSLRRHLRHARPVVKWRRLEPPTGGDSIPATVIGWAEAGTGHHQVVLIDNHPTPIRLGGQIHTFRSRHQSRASSPKKKT